jgi:type IV secretory pathway VirB10-like protein
MKSVLGLSACLLLTTALAACNKSEPAAPAATTATPATAPAASDSAAPAMPAAPTPPPADDNAPVSLDMRKIKTWMQAQKNLAEVEKADPSLDAAQNASEENVTQYAERLKANAKMRAAIESAGLSTLDFARIGDTLIGAMMTEAALKGGQLKKVPDGIDPASVEFVKQHDAEIKAMMGAGAG